MPYHHTLAGTRHVFADLKTLLARATPLRSGDQLAGIAAASASERVAAQMALADLPLRTLLDEPVIPYEDDDVTRLILDGHDRAAFAPVAHLTVGGFRDFLLAEATPEILAALRPGLTPEMAAAVSKIMRLQDLVAVAAKCRVTTAFRNTIGLPGRLSVRLQPNHPVDDPRGVAAATLDGLLLGAGDAVIGVNPATDSVAAATTLLHMLDGVRDRYAIPTQTCVLAHVTTTLRCIEAGAPVDLVFQSIGGTEATNRAFGVTLRPAGRSPRGGAGAAARHGRAERDVFRDRPGQRPVGRGASRRRPADHRGARLCGGAGVRAVAGQYGGRLHRPRVPV